MAVMSGKGLLADADNPARMLRFQYNPTVTRESKVVHWAEANIPGGDDGLATFGSGKSPRLQLNLFLNVLGEDSASRSRMGNLYEKRGGVNYYVENVLAFLYSFTEENSVRLTYSPGVLLFAFGNARFPGSQRQSLGGLSLPALPVRIEEIEVERIAFHRTQLVTLRAEARLQLSRHSGFPS